MLNKLRLRLRALFFKSQMEEELNEEVRFHLEREIEENIARGMNLNEARCRQCGAVTPTALSRIGAIGVVERALTEIPNDDNLIP